MREQSPSTHAERNIRVAESFRNESEKFNFVLDQEIKNLEKALIILESRDIPDSEMISSLQKMGFNFRIIYRDGGDGMRLPLYFLGNEEFNDRHRLSDLLRRRKEDLYLLKDRLHKNGPQSQEIEQVAGNLLKIYNQASGQRDLLANDIEKIARQKERERVSREFLTGTPDALFDQLNFSKKIHLEMMDKILILPKSARDQQIAALLNSLHFHLVLANDDWQEQISQKLSEKIATMIKNRNQPSGDLREIFRRGSESVLDGTYDLVGLLAGEGGDDDFLMYFLAKNRELAKYLLEPVTYEPELLAKIKNEILADFQQLAKKVDLKGVEDLVNASKKILSLPDRFLSAEKQADFKIIFSRFTDSSYALQRDIFEKNRDDFRKIYIFSHGENNSEFPEADSQWRAKFLQWQGEDLWRKAQIFSPFGVLLPRSVSHGGQNVKLESYWDDFAQKNGRPLSLTFQSFSMASAGLLAEKVVPLALRGSWKAGRFLLNIHTAGLANRILPSSIATLANRLSTPMRGFWQAWLAYEIGSEMRQWHISANDEKILQILVKYQNPQEISAEEVKEIRKTVLLTEIERRRELFQRPGSEEKLLQLMEDPSWLQSFGMRAIPYLHWRFWRGSMEEEGTLREALVSANEKLLQLGIATFELP